MPFFPPRIIYGSVIYLGDIFLFYNSSHLSPKCFAVTWALHVFLEVIFDIYLEPLWQWDHKSVHMEIDMKQDW